MGENTQGQINSSFGSVNYSEFVDGNFESDTSIVQIVGEDKVCALSSLNEIICKGVRNYSISDIGDILELDSGEKHLCLTTSDLIFIVGEITNIAQLAILNQPLLFLGQNLPTWWTLIW